jgi:hypothetical protein
MSITYSCRLFVLGDVVVLRLCVVHDFLCSFGVVALVRAVLRAFNHVFILSLLHFELKGLNAGFGFGRW